MKQLTLILVLILSWTIHSVAQNAVNLDDNGQQSLPAYDLSIGVERHYNECFAFDIVCTGIRDPVGFERVEDHIIIDGKSYAKVTWFRTVGYNSSTESHYYQTDTLYYRTLNDTLYQWTPQADSLIFDFSFKGGMDYRTFFNAFLPVPLSDYMIYGNNGIPVQFDFDTTATFPDELNYRIVYGHSDYDDDYENLSLPTQKEFIENHLQTLINTQMQQGMHKVTFNAQDLASGVYVYQLRTENTTLTKLMTLVK